jgi:hypothetical protein
LLLLAEAWICACFALVNRVGAACRLGYSLLHNGIFGKSGDLGEKGVFFMKTVKWNEKLASVLIIRTFLISPLSFWGTAIAAAQESAPATLDLIRVLEADQTEVTIDPASGDLLVEDGEHSTTLTDLRRRR